jgi:hypothetical protein
MTLSEILDATIAKLNADEDVVAKLEGRIYKRRPASGTEYPFAEIKILSDTPWDTIGATGNNTTFAIDVYTRESLTTGDGEAAIISDIVKASLHRQPLAVSGIDTVMLVYEFGSPVNDRDVTIEHFTTRYRILTQ